MHSSVKRQYNRSKPFPDFAEVRNSLAPSLQCWNIGRRLARASSNIEEWGRGGQTSIYIERCGISTKQYFTTILLSVDGTRSSLVSPLKKSALEKHIYLYIYEYAHLCTCAHADGMAVSAGVHKYGERRTQDNAQVSLAIMELGCCAACPAPCPPRSPMLLMSIARVS